MQLLIRFFQQLSERSRTIIQTCIYGVAGGAAAVAFVLLSGWLYSVGLERLSHQPIEIFLAGSFLMVVVSSLVVGWLLRSFGPEAEGSGIPQLKLSFNKDRGWVPFRVAIVKFFAGVLSLGGGASLGREGPSVQIAGTVASNLAGATGEKKENRRAAVAAGAAAGLAAAFNTPLAATTFVLEEIVGDLNSRLLGGVLLASVLGALIVHGVIGLQPAFVIKETAPPSWMGYLLTPIVAGLSGLVGVYFQRISLRLRQRMKKEAGLPAWSGPVWGGMLTWVLGVAVFWTTGHLGVFSLGYQDLSNALSGNVIWQVALILLLAKFLATSVCYGFLGCGGIFSPTLFFGGMIGAVIAGITNLAFPILHADALTLMVVGMSSCLGAVVGAPITGILIVFEMTHEFSLVPVLMIGAIVSQTVSRLMNRENFYKAVLLQDGHPDEHIHSPRDLHDWQHVSVSAIANFNPIVLHDLNPATLEKVLKGNAYRRFGIQLPGPFYGILERSEVQAALFEKRKPNIEKTLVCERSNTIGWLEEKIVNFNSECALVIDRVGGEIIGLITINDLLRAEVQRGRMEKDGTLQ